MEGGGRAAFGERPPGSCLLYSTLILLLLSGEALTIEATCSRGERIAWLRYNESDVL